MEYLNRESLLALFSEYSPTKNPMDTGSPDPQIALFTTRIAHLTAHLKVHPKDHSTRLSLLRMVGKRKRLVKYIKSKDPSRYEALRQRLGLRK